MRKYFCILFCVVLLGCQDLGSLLQSPTESIIPTETETAKALTESLVIGMSKASDRLSIENGFFANDLIKIPFPQDAQNIASALQTVGAGKLVEDTVLSLNRAAENASGVAKNVLVSAIKAMTIQDAMNILLGPDDAATTYLKQTTTPTLLTQFRPIIQSSLSQVHATEYWTQVTTKYNQINVMNVFGKPVETDLTSYVSGKALDGLFYMVEKEEKSIRDNPIERTTALLKKVFGYADTKKQ
ncbi:MAG: DUF4197 domain-containing protein [Bdellovibrionales bacterium]|nr:DUF4197 domain-containing protein [Bdellovibrionales bacterium]